MSKLSEDEVDKELLPFLSLSARPDLKCVAIQYFLGLTGTPEGIQFITKKEKYLHAILDLLHDDGQDIAKFAFQAVVNLTSDENTCNQIISLSMQPNFLTFILEYIMKSDSLHADLACQILSNMSHYESSAGNIVSTMVNQKNTIGFERLIQAFCQENYNKNAQLHYLGPLLSNLTQIQLARQSVLDKEQCVMQRLLPFTEYAASIIRRRGIVGAIKNCCFETEHHGWLMSETVDILPRLLLPLAGPEELDDEDNEKLPDDLQYLEPDKTREPDPEIRKMLIEALFRLCATKPCRLYIKEKNTYILLRELHKWEQDPSVHMALEPLIQVLIADEPEPGMENLAEVEIPEDIQKKFHKVDETLKKELEEEKIKTKKETGS